MKRKLVENGGKVPCFILKVWMHKWASRSLDAQILASADQNASKNGVKCEHWEGCQP